MWLSSCSLCGCSTQDSHVFLPPEFLLLRSFFISIFIPRLLPAWQQEINTSVFLAAWLSIFLLSLGATDFYLLASMSYDHYVAICKPLHYLTIMSSRVCIQLVFCLARGALAILPPIILISQMNFCASNVLNQYYCDYRPLLEVACSDTSLLELIVIFLAAVTLVVTLVLVTLSYTYIIRTILRITSAQQRTKSSATCSSHMTVILLSYGSCIFFIHESITKRREFQQGNISAHDFS